jgi:hypothetical protein
LTYIYISFAALFFFYWFDFLIGFIITWRRRCGGRSVKIPSELSSRISF